MEEILDVYDESGRRVGTAPRSRCHGDPGLIHRTVHVVVFHPQGGALLLQKRSRDKDIQPGKWDTAVGGHLRQGEALRDGALRELEEELGVSGRELAFLFESRIRNEIESENVGVYALTHAGPFAYQKEEIDEVRFWTFEELRDPGNARFFTPNLCDELEMLWTHLAAQQTPERIPPACDGRDEAQ